ncbi:hypothetical protein [Methanosarcina sp. KYL-1]|nr:hypothetical protein [Methanosarcina sp. KYL-1]
MFKSGERVKFGNVGGKGNVISEGTFETLVKFDDGDICKVDSAFLFPVSE